MKRRDFLWLLGGAGSWPLVARAQNESMKRIGVLMNSTSENLDSQTNLAAFLQVLQRSNWTDGRNVRIETRWGGGEAEMIGKRAEELVALKPDVILATGNVAMAPLLKATRTVPVVFVSVADPVGAGFVESMARPGGNVTGFIQFEYSLSGKWVELLREIAPAVKRAAVLRDPAISAGVGQFAVSAPSPTSRASRMVG